MELLGSHTKLIFEYLAKSVEEFQVSLKSDKNDGTSHDDLCTFMIVSRGLLLRMRNVSDNVVEKIKLQ